METVASEAFDGNFADSTFFKGNICGPIAASMNESMFILVISKWRYAFEGLKETNDYKFLSAAGSLVKIMVINFNIFICFISIILTEFVLHWHLVIAFIYMCG